MPMTWRFDLLDGWTARASQRSVELVRPAMVYDIPVVAGASDPEVLLKIIADAGFPGFGSAFPTTDPDSKFKGATLQDVQIRTRDRRTNSVRVDLCYSKSGISNNPLQKSSWTLEDSGNISHIPTAGTADGSKQIQVWHKPGFDKLDPTKPSDADTKTIQMTRMVPSRVLRATAEFTADQWAVSRAAVRATIGTINSATWGSSDRGRWFHAPATIRTNDKGKSLVVTLSFLENTFGWYPLGVYHDNVSGKIPPDIATERTLRNLFFAPAVNETINLTGIVMASVYGESDFAAGLPFSPDDV